MSESLVLLAVRRFEPNRKPPRWWRGRVMALGAGPGSTFGLATVGSNYWIIIDPSWRTKCSPGAQQVWVPTWRRAGSSSPAQREPPVPFPTERSHHDHRLIDKGSTPRCGPIGSPVDEARRRERRGNDRLQARQARKGRCQTVKAHDHGPS